MTKFSMHVFEKF